MEEQQSEETEMTAEEIAESLKTFMQEKGIKVEEREGFGLNFLLIGD